MVYLMTWTSVTSRGLTNTSAAKGEGTSSGAGSPDRSRAAKMRRKDVAAEQPSFVIPENEFEFAMGLFQKITDEKCPYLHLVCSVLLPSARVTNPHA